MSDLFKSRQSRRAFVAGTAVAGAAVLTWSASSAQDGTPIASPEAEGGPGLPPLPEGATVVGRGLINPRNIAIADDGTLYVTEVGTGGSIAISPPEVGTSELATPITDDATPIAEDPFADATLGYTGRISQINPDGSQGVLIDGLFSSSIGVGPCGIVLHPDGNLYYTIGGVSVGLGVTPAPEENTVNRLDPATGASEVVAELGPYEVANNPDSTDINPNLYGLAVDGDDLIVLDAGGNTVYSVDVEDGEFDLEYVVPNLTELSGIEPGPGEEPRQAVPTSIIVDGDNLIVSLLSEAWPADGASIISFNDDPDTIETLVTGASGVTSIARDPQGTLHYCQLFDDFTTGAPIGSVRRVTADGSSTEPVVEGLFMPHGIAFDGDGNLFVTTAVLASSPDAAIGQVLRFEAANL